jgi:translation initiation factor IF-3
VGTDYDVRKRAALKFLEGGHRVKLLVVFRGREQQFSEINTTTFALSPPNTSKKKNKVTVQENSVVVVVISDGRKNSKHERCS